MKDSMDLLSVCAELASFKIDSVTTVDVEPNDLLFINLFFCAFITWRFGNKTMFQIASLAVNFQR